MDLSRPARQRGRPPALVVSRLRLVNNHVHLLLETRRLNCAAACRGFTGSTRRLSTSVTARLAISSKAAMARCASEPTPSCGPRSGTSLATLSAPNYVIGRSSGDGAATVLRLGLECRAGFTTTACCPYCPGRIGTPGPPTFASSPPESPNRATPSEVEPGGCPAAGGLGGLRLAMERRSDGREFSLLGPVSAGPTGQAWGAARAGVASESDPS